MQDKQTTACNEECRLSEEEREWLHTARKYIDSRHLPTLGKLLRLFDDASYTVGKAVLTAILVGGGSLLLWWTVIKIKG